MSDRLDLSGSDRKEVARILDTVASGIEVWVYGSHINGAACEMSDLDSVLRRWGLEPNDVLEPEPVRSAFSESNIPILADVLARARIPESFRQEIKAGYIESQ